MTPVHPSKIPTLSREIKQRFVKHGHRWYVHTTHGIAHVGEVPLSAFTLKGAQRKAERLVRKLRKRDEAPTLERMCPGGRDRVEGEMQAGSPAQSAVKKTARNFGSQNG